MSQRELNQAVAAIREEQPDEKAVHGAAARVFGTLFKASFLPDSVERIRGCADFQSLIPGYLNHSLSPARLLLFQDHVLQCVTCRRALHEAQTGEAATPFGTANGIPASVQKSSAHRKWRAPVMAWAVAATLVIGIVTGWIAGEYGFLPGQTAVRATVANVEGNLYRVTRFGSALIKVGEVITSADDLRTASGSRAILRLIGGGELEIGERSDVSLSNEWRATTVNVEEGQVIATTSGTQVRDLYLSGGGVTVPVKSAVLAFDRGVKGARVAVAQGSAQVTEGQKSYPLSAGQQMATNGLQKVPIASEFSWSSKSESYLALLSEFSTLQKQIQEIPSPALRYSSDLAAYVPEHAVLYAAIPNLGGTISEAKRIFDERLASSSVLRDWWGQKSVSHSADFDRLIEQISSVSKYLGDEIVLSVSSNGPGSYSAPVLLADVHNRGLADYLRQNVPTSAIEVATAIAEVPASAPAKTAARSNDRLIVLLTNKLLIASTDAAEVRRAAERAQNSASGTFTKTPFYARIEKSYSSGVGYLFAVDLEQIGKKSVNNSTQSSISGLDDVQYLVLERRDLSGATDTRATLSFNSARQGVASWLGSPGPVGSLEFVSPNASFATAFIMKSPKDMVTELISTATQNNASFSEELNSFETQAGIKVIDDVAAPFGSDVTFAVDGPLLPIPSWKLVIEVEDPARLQQTLTALIARWNQTSGKTGKLQVDSEQVNSRTFYSLRNTQYPNLAAYYTFVDGYLLAGPSKANLVQAIQNRQAGYTLVNSANFRNQLPPDNYTNFSAMLYTNVAGSLSSVTEQLKGMGSLTPAQQQAVSTLVANSGPGLICVYGEPDRIEAATRSYFLGFNLATLARVQQGQSVLPIIASSIQSVSASAQGGGSQQQRR